MNIHDNNSNEVLTNIPSILYKYRTWKLDSHKDLLKEGLVFFAAPNTFADPFDCNTPKKYPSGGDLIRYYYQLSLKDKPDYSDAEHWESAVLSSIRSPMNNAFQLMQINYYDRVDFNKTHGILCLCKSPKNDRMWEEYADMFQGFCVGLNTNQLIRHFSYGKVKYVLAPTIDIMKDSVEEQIFKRLFLKESSYSFEQEYRFIMSGLGKELTNQDRLVSVKESIVEVHLGKNMNAENKNEIITIVENNYPNAIIIDKCINTKAI